MDAPTAPPESMPCTTDGCRNPARRNGYCWTCVWRRRVRKSCSTPVRARCRTTEENLREAALNYANADQEDDAAFERAWKRLDMAAVRHGRRRIGRP